MKKSKSTKPTFVEKRRKEMRYFSEDARKSIVHEIDEGHLSKAAASRKYEVSQSAIYKWIRIYSPKYSAPLKKVVEHESDSQRNKKLESELKQVYESFGRLQTEHMLLEKIVEMASSELGIDLKKNFANKPSITSGKRPRQD